MMKFFFGILLLAHGMIHLMGFLKSFSIVELPQLLQSIQKNVGMLFLFTSVLFLVGTIFLFIKNDLWFIITLVGTIISQILIILYWQDAKFGTIINGIILFVTILAFATWNFRNTYESDVETAFAKALNTQTFVTQEELDRLPRPVQKYLNYVNVVGKQKVVNLSLKFNGEMRGKDQDWFPFTSEQFNFIEDPTRLFFMIAQIKGIPIAGYHNYQNDVASMQIKLLSLFTVANNNSQELFVSETVTIFNDLCLFAPISLVDNRITWEEINDTSVKAYFSNKGTTISAKLYFNEEGQLINFVSEDRYDINRMKKYQFSTPVSKYKEFNGYMLPSYGEAIWHYPEGEFIYGKFNLKQIDYNTISLKN